MTRQQSAPPPTRRSPADRRVDWRTIVVFYLLACALAWALAVPMWTSGRGLATPGTSLLIRATMYTPLVAAVAAAIVLERTPWRQLPRRLGWWPPGPARRMVLLCVTGFLVSVLIPVAAVGLGALLGLIHLDLRHFSGMAQLLSTRVPSGTHVPVGAVAAIQLAELPLAAVTNCLVTLGEETGWRGLLLPALRPLGTWPALLVSGALWGLWHAPIILLGYNFNRPNAAGVGLMVVACAVQGSFIGWLRIRSATIWPSALAHGALNAVGGFSLLVIAADTTTDPAATGPLGWLSWLLTAAVMAVLAARHRVPGHDSWR